MISGGYYGFFFIKKAAGLSNISDLLDKSGIFYNFSTKTLPSLIMIPQENILHAKIPHGMENMLLEKRLK